MRSAAERLRLMTIVLLGSTLGVDLLLLVLIWFVIPVTPLIGRRATVALSLLFPVGTGVLTLYMTRVVYPRMIAEPMGAGGP